MPHVIYFIIIGLIIVLLIAMLVYFKTSKKVKQNINYKKQLESMLINTKQHLKYKNKVSVQTFVIVASTILFALTLVFFAFLPVFQIKFELLGETVTAKNFSFYTNYLKMKNENNEALKCYTDIDSSVILFFFLVAIALPVFSMLLSCFSREIKTFDSELRTMKFYIETKSNQSVFGEIIFNCLNMVLDYALSVAITIYTIISCKNAEHEFKSDIQYTTKNINNYICYYKDNGNLIMKVFQNDFKYCNGVSGYIAIPIICLLLAIGLFAVGIYLKCKLKKEINAEKVEGLEEPATIENNNAQ